VQQLNRSEAINEMKAIWSVLDSDIELALEYGRVADTPYAQRALVRAFFAAVEGLSYQLRQVTLATLGKSKLLTYSERALLAEERYFIDDKGQSKSTSAFLQFPQSLLFSINTYVKNHGAEFSPDLSGHGWHAFRRTTNVRHRVTHPKSASSLILTEVEIEDLMVASKWWNDTMLSMFQACKQADDYWSNVNSKPEADS
jgi:hypothetical protein